MRNGGSRLAMTSEIESLCVPHPNHSHLAKPHPNYSRAQSRREQVRIWLGQANGVGCPTFRQTETRPNVCSASPARSGREPEATRVGTAWRTRRKGARCSLWSAHRRGVIHQLAVDLHLSGLLRGRSTVVALGSGRRLGARLHIVPAEHNKGRTLSDFLGRAWKSLRGASHEPMDLVADCRAVTARFFRFVLKGGIIYLVPLLADENQRRARAAADASAGIATGAATGTASK